MRGSGVWEPGEKEWSMHTGTAEMARGEGQKRRKIQKKRQILILVVCACDPSVAWGWRRTEVSAY